MFDNIIYDEEVYDPILVPMESDSDPNIKPQLTTITLGTDIGVSALNLIDHVSSNGNFELQNSIGIITPVQPPLIDNLSN